MTPQPHILHIIPNFIVGGMEVRVCSLINRFGDSLRHSIFSMNGRVDAAQLIDANIEIDYLDISFNKKSQLRNPFLFRSHLKRIRPDLLLTYNWGSIEWAMANSLRPICPQIHAEDGFDADEAVAQKSGRCVARRMFLRHCHKVVVPSATLKEIAISKWRVHAPSVLHIPNGVNLSRFTNSSHSALPSELQTDDVVVGIVASLSPVKNHMRMLRVFSKLPSDCQAQLWIIGDGTEAKRLRQYAGELKLEDRVKFLGHQQDPEVHLSRCDIFALSSDSEQMPISVLEAMASGCAIISTDVGDIREMVCSEGQDFVVPREREDLYVQRLRQLILDTALRVQLQSLNRQKCASEYDRDTMFTRYRELYTEAIASDR